MGLAAFNRMRRLQAEKANVEEVQQEEKVGTQEEESVQEDVQESDEVPGEEKEGVNDDNNTRKGKKRSADNEQQ